MHHCTEQNYLGGTCVTRLQSLSGTRRGVIRTPGEIIQKIINEADVSPVRGAELGPYQPMMSCHIFPGMITRPLYPIYVLCTFYPVHRHPVRSLNSRSHPKSTELLLRSTNSYLNFGSFPLVGCDIDSLPDACLWCLFSSPRSLTMITLLQGVRDTSVLQLREFIGFVETPSQVPT